MDSIHRERVIFSAVVLPVPENGGHNQGIGIGTSAATLALAGRAGTARSHNPPPRLFHCCLLSDGCSVAHPPPPPSPCSNSNARLLDLTAPFPTPRISCAGRLPAPMSCSGSSNGETQTASDRYVLLSNRSFSCSSCRSIDSTLADEHAADDLARAEPITVALHRKLCLLGLLRVDQLDMAQVKALRILLQQPTFHLHKHPIPCHIRAAPTPKSSWSFCTRWRTWPSWPAWTGWLRSCFFRFPLAPLTRSSPPPPSPNPSLPSPLQPGPSGAAGQCAPGGTLQ